jgi:hypothetical protein
MWWRQPLNELTFAFVHFICRLLFIIEMMNHRLEYKLPSTLPVPTSRHASSPKSTHLNHATMKYLIYYKREGIHPYWGRSCRLSLPFHP